MLRISLPWIIDVARSLDALDNLTPETETYAARFALIRASNSLESAFDASVYNQHLTVSRQKAIELRTAIQKISSKPFEQRVEAYEYASIRQIKDQLQTIFTAELAIIPTYLVGEKEGYNLSTLTESGQKLFPVSLGQKVPSAVTDAAQAGKALAFELPTACGFHTFRAVESVLRRYWTSVSNGADLPKLQTIGNMACELEKSSYGDSKVWESLKQLAKLHRNPLIHPEAILTTEEAITTLGIARSVVGAMLAHIPDAQITTDTAEAAKA